MIYTKDFIKEKILTNDLWLARGVVAIYKKQTDREQMHGYTEESNGVGFNKVDSEILTSFAEFFLKRGFLSSKQIYIARKKMVKYCGQLAKIANKEI